MAALSASGWAVLAVAVGSLWGVAVWALYRSLTDEERKLELIREQGEIDTYSPRALRELREWYERNPEDPLAEEARRRHNECVQTLREIDEPFYDWSEEEIARLEKL